MSCKVCISASEFDVSGAIHNTKTGETIVRGEATGTNTVIYPDIRAKTLIPWKGNEKYEFEQNTATIDASWLIRNISTQTIVAKNMAFVTDGEYHHIKAVRKYIVKGRVNRKYIVLDTIYRDSDNLN